MSHVDAYSELEDVEGDEKPWCDLVFDLTEVRISGKRRLFGRDERVLHLSAAASTERGDIGFGFQSAPVADWDKKDSDGLKLAWGRVKLKSIGAATDRLVGEYERWFDFPVSESAAVDEIECLAVLIDGDPGKFETAVTHMKLFLEPEDEREGEYGEVFLNFDLPSRRIWLREKDPEYRKPLVGWLTGEYGVRSGVLH